MAYKQRYHSGFDRCVILLRKGESTVLRATYPGGTSHWVREVVARHCNTLRARQRRKAKAEREQLLRAINDPNL
jgi:hypothetical protein